MQNCRVKISPENTIKSIIQVKLKNRAGRGQRGVRGILVQNPLIRFPPNTLI